MSITLRTPDGRIARVARNLPLRGVSPGSHGSNDIAVTVGDEDSHLAHDVRNVAAMRIELTTDQAERALVMETKDGATTRIEFRSPMRVEEVDGLPTPHRC